MAMDRREFLAMGSAALGAGAAVWSASRDANASPLGSQSYRADRLTTVGVQLFSLPKLLEQDLDGTLAMLAGLGYREVELYGPYGFSTPEAIESWKAMGARLGFTASGTYGRTPKEFRALLDTHGLTAASAHIELASLLARPEQVGEAAQALGLQYLGISNIPAPYRKTLDDYKRMADRFNEMGAKAKPYGFKVLYHNHGYGLAPMEGEIPLRVLLDRVDAAVFAAEMDLFWTTAGGADPVELLTTYPKLYRLLHIKDMSERVRFAGDGGDASQWMALFPKMTTAGNGVLALPKILSAAKRVGVQHYLVEQDLVANPKEALGASIRYLKGVELGG
ncbi:MAG: TIM barrel protein [Gemmatimonadaceae bacterium]